MRPISPVQLDGVALEAVLNASQAGSAEPSQLVFHLFSKDGARGWVRAAGGKEGALRSPAGDVAARLAQVPTVGPRGVLRHCARTGVLLPALRARSVWHLNVRIPGCPGAHGSPP